MRSSRSRNGNCWDDAPTESLWGRLKIGQLYGKRFATQRDAMDEVIAWLTFYNHRRLHSTLGYVKPMKFEENWQAGQSGKAAQHNCYLLRRTGASSLPGGGTRSKRGRHPAPAGAAGQWLARTAPKVLSPHNFMSCAAPPSP